LALATLVVAVRGAGLLTEGLAPGVAPKPFAASLYPVVVLGPPAAVTTFARTRRPDRAAALTAAGFGVGLAVDLAVVGAVTVPVRLALHRVALASALALFALGVARADRWTTVLGVGAWFCTLVRRFSASPERLSSRPQRISGGAGN
jgi:hypothetical protein